MFYLNAETNVEHTSHVHNPISLPNSDFPSAAVTGGRVSLADDDTDPVAAKSPAVDVTQTASTTPPPAKWQAGRQEWLIVICLAIVSLMVALDATIVIPVLPTMAIALEANVVQSFWIGSAYLLPYAIFQPVISTLSDVFGRRELLLFVVVSFVVGSIVAALAHEVSQMLVGRVIQGIGGGGIVCLTFIVVTDVIPLRERAAFLAIPQLAWAIGTILGPLIGGALSQSWRWIFWINLPFGGLGLVMVPLVVKLKHQDRVTLRVGLARIDYIGILLFVGGTTAFLVGLSWGGVEFAWKSYQTLLPLILGLAVIVMSFLWETRVAKAPFIKLSVYQNSSSIATLVAAFTQGYILYSGLYMWNIYYQGVLGKSPISTGVALLPVMLSTAPSSISTGVLLKRGMGFRPLVILGWILVVIGTGLSILWFVDTPASAWAIIQIVCGIGHGIILTASIIALQSHVKATEVGGATGMYSFTRGLGLAVGVSIAGTILQNRMKFWLKSADLPVAIAEDITGYIVTLNSLPQSEQDFAGAVRLAIARSYRNLSEVSLGVACLGLLTTFALRKGDMDQALASRQQVERGSEKQAGIEMGEIRADSATEVAT